MTTHIDPPVFECFVEPHIEILREILTQNATILELNKRILEQLCNPLVTLSSGSIDE